MSLKNNKKLKKNVENLITPKVEPPDEFDQPLTDEIKTLQNLKKELNEVNTPRVTRSKVKSQVPSVELKKEPEKLKTSKTNKKDQIKFHESQILTVKINGEQKYSCSICSAIFAKRFSVQPHILRVHLKKKDKVCRWCERGFAHTGDLTRHERTHTGDRRFKCNNPGCGFAFFTSGELIKHSKRHLNGGFPKQHGCDECSQAFETRYDLKLHKLRHEMEVNPDAGAFQCQICKKRFVRKDQYTNHQNIHTGIKPYKCECGKSFSDPSNFNKHKKTHLGVQDAAKLKCDRCGNEFKNKVSIARHNVACLKKTTNT